MRTAYKIVTDELRSAVVYNYFVSGIDLTVQYIKGEFVRPNLGNTYLMAFDTLKNAEIFRREHTNLLIYKCDVIWPDKIQESKIRLLKKDMQCRDINTWNYFSYDYRKEIGIPQGTVFCEQIRLTEQVG